jgi:hypothetical protein
MAPQTTKQRGYNLEGRVARMFRRMGKYNIRQNVMVRDSNGNLSEFDVTYGYFFRRYIECKNYTHPVGLEYPYLFFPSPPQLLQYQMSVSRCASLMHAILNTFSPRAVAGAPSRCCASPLPRSFLMFNYIFYLFLTLFKAVAKFKEVLKLNGIPVRHGIFITTSTFTPRATTIGTLNSLSPALLSLSLLLLFPFSQAMYLLI